MAEISMNGEKVASLKMRILGVIANDGENVRKCDCISGFLEIIIRCFDEFENELKCENADAIQKSPENERKVEEQPEPEPESSENEHSNSEPLIVSIKDKNAEISHQNGPNEHNVVTDIAQLELDQKAKDASSTESDEFVKNATSNLINASEKNDECVIEIDEGDEIYKYNLMTLDEITDATAVQPIELSKDIIHQNQMTNNEDAPNSSFEDSKNFKLFQKISKSLHQISFTNQNQSSSPNKNLIDNSSSSEFINGWIESEMHEVEIVTTTLTECQQIVKQDLVKETPRKRKNRIKMENNFKRRRSMDVPKSAPATSHRSNVTKSTDSKLVLAQKKRNSDIRKTISFAPRIKTDDADDTKLDRKNTDRNMHPKSNLYRSLCVLCDKKERFLVVHYVREHSNLEVFIARPSPLMAERLRLQIEKFKINGTKIEGWCFFCEEMKKKTRHEWALHFLTHTGETLLTCHDCDFRSHSMVQHTNCATNLVNIYEPNSTNGSLMAFMCNDCNYLQINFERMVKHMINEHGYKEAAENRQFQKIVLIPDYLPPKMEIKHEFAVASKVFRCTICQKRCQNAAEFEAHFDEVHNQVEKYKCFCGEQMVLDGCALLGSFITAHLLNHSADLYQCMVCKDIFFEKADIFAHLYHEHAECEFRFHHVRRETDKEATVAETTVNKIVCNVCNEHLVAGTFADATKHFEQVHQNQSVDLSAFASKKVSKLAKRACDVETTYLCGQLYNVKT